MIGEGQAPCAIYFELGKGDVLVPIAAISEHVSAYTRPAKRTAKVALLGNISSKNRS
jgi:hypothetical protein